MDRGACTDRLSSELSYRDDSDDSPISSGLSDTWISIPAFIVIGSLPTCKPRGFSKGGAPSFGLSNCMSCERLPVLGSFIRLCHLNLAAFRASFKIASACSFSVTGSLTWNYSSLMCWQWILRHMKSMTSWRACWNSSGLMTLTCLKKALCPYLKF